MIIVDRFIFTPIFIFLMEITVNREITIKEIQTEKQTYQTNYEKSVNIYKKKVGEYAKYVERVSKSAPMDGLKSPPFPPHSSTETFDNALEMLSAHVGATLKMSNDEYRQLRSGMRASHVANVNSITELNSLSY